MFAKAAYPPRRGASNLEVGALQAFLASRGSLPVQRITSHSKCIFFFFVVPSLF